MGKNLCAQLNNIKDGKARCYGDLKIEEVFEYDLDSTPEQLDAWCKECDFVFNLAGVNRPKDNDEFMKGNFGFASTLLDTLKAHKNTCPVMLSSSQQASLAGRFGNSEYGRSKKAGDRLNRFFIIRATCGITIHGNDFQTIKLAMVLLALQGVDHLFHKVVDVEQFEFY